MPAEAPTIATVLKSMGYATGQFGKNHLGDRNAFLPCVHGFDEFLATSTTSMRWKILRIPTIHRRSRIPLGHANMLTCQAKQHG